MWAGEKEGKRDKETRKLRTEVDPRAAIHSLVYWPRHGRARSE